MSTPTTWEDAADRAIVELFEEGPHPYAPMGFEQVNTWLRCDLNDLVEDSYHADHSPKSWLSALACGARDCLIALDAMPTIEQIVRVLAEKQANYGTRNILAFGIKGIIIRLSDKVARIENMLAKGRESVDEPLTDAYLDIIGYAAIALMLEHGWFDLPLARDLPDAGVGVAPEPTEPSLDGGVWVIDLIYVR